MKSHINVRYRCRIQQFLISYNVLLTWLFSETQFAWPYESDSIADRNLRKSENLKQSYPNQLINLKFSRSFQNSTFWWSQWQIDPSKRRKLQKLKTPLIISKLLSVKLAQKSSLSLQSKQLIKNILFKKLKQGQLLPQTTKFILHAKQVSTH